MAYGQKYRDLPLAERFGEWPVDERQMAIQRLIEEFEKQRDVWGRAPQDYEPVIERSWPSGYIRI
jgi:hypothetical protein